MQDKPENKRKKAVTPDEPVHTVRAGSVEASIWRRQSPSGYSYFDYSLARSFRSLSSGNVGYSKNFFAGNQDDLATVIGQATRWIAEYEQQPMTAEAAAA
jgi:hypothetical protein